MFDVEEFVPCSDPKLIVNFGKVLINETKSLILYIFNENPVTIEIQDLENEMPSKLTLYYKAVNANNELIDNWSELMTNRDSKKKSLRLSHRQTMIVFLDLTVKGPSKQKSQNEKVISFRTEFEKV